ncbi:hypothetical protein QOZ80_7AG0560730 [Eleusine coracana subsp. coracana]|nr:hypothetical protein QOZ80_7AG0560730 [Eleusine coracana subsp. coracana]
MSSGETSSASSQSDSEEHEEEQPLSQPEGSEDRRARAEAQWPTDKVIVTAIAADGMPIPKKERQRMRRLAGLIARQRVSLVLSNFSSLGKEGKKVMFTDYVMPYLEFNKEMKDKGLKRSMKAISKCWRNYKSTLVKEFIIKKRSPFERFKHLKQEDWDAFVKLKYTEEFQQISERYKLLREKNKHPHHLGTRGYDGKIEVWAAEDERLATDGLDNPWWFYPGLLKEPTLCTLLADIGGYSIEVAKGQCGYQVQGCNAGTSHKYEATTVGEALLQWVQWRKSYVVINSSLAGKDKPPKVPNVIPEPPKKGDQGSQSDKNGEGKNVKKPKGSQQGSQEDKNEGCKKAKKSKSSQQDLNTNGPSTPEKAEAKRAMSAETGKKVKVTSIASAAAATSSKMAEHIKTPLLPMWTGAHYKFKLGKPIMSTTDLQKAGPFCVSLHSYYLQSCRDKKKQFMVLLKGHHLVKSDGGPFIVDFADLYDLFHFDVLDVSIVRLFAL